MLMSSGAVVEKV